uniref:Endonuclease/exonuclease/phosphatase domain-containing protein n=1 Tax=Amphimedon queenslandica TaxID=400682 RepID=A0A1X7TQC6_AMPQE
MPHMRKPLLFLKLCWNNRLIPTPKSAKDVSNALFSHLLSIPCPNSTPLFIVGDFNFPEIDWSSYTGSTIPSASFCRSLFIHNLSQLIDAPTHKCGNILDLLLTNSPDYISNININNCHDLSDHFPVLFNITISYVSYQSKSKEVYNYSKVDTDGLSSYLYSLDHTATFLPCDVDSAWSSFKHCVSSARELFVPLATIPSSSLPKWFDSELRHELNRVRSSRRRFLQKGSPSDLQLQKL